MSSAILYIGFLVGSYPCSLLAQIFPVDRTAGGLLFLWGACLTSTVVCANFQGLFAQRFFLEFWKGEYRRFLCSLFGGWGEHEVFVRDSPVHR